MAEAPSRTTGAGRPDPAAMERLFLAGLVVVFLAGFALVRPAIVSAGNLQNILVQASYLSLFAGAQAIVILTRGFDLSLGVTVSLVSVAAALAMTAVGGDGGVAAGIAAGLAAGCAVGLVNGLLVSVGGINPFVVTLGTMNIVLTFSSTLSGGFPVAPLPPGLALLATARPFGIPVQLAVAALVLLLLHLTLRRTVFGRALYLIGSNPAAARLSGLRCRLHLTGAYMLCSGLIALGAVLLTARTGSGEPNLGGNLTMESIAAAVLGGIRLRGGEGDVLAPLLGALLVTVLSNGMNLTNVDGFVQQITLGAVIVAALALDQLRARL